MRLNSDVGESFYYWQWVHPAVHSEMDRGVCALMYGEEYGIWAVEKPDSGRPTAIYEFNERREAEDFAETMCWSWNKNWRDVKAQLAVWK